MTVPVGTRLGAYEVVSLLGAGGMGEVYRARDTNLGRDVAIKILPADVAADAERLGRFKREAQLLAALNHPNIAAIYGLDQADGRPFLVLELVEGEDLAERLARGAIPVGVAVPIARQLAQALEEAHEHGIVHRDLKPANVKLASDGKIKVLDFGLAKALAVDGSHASTPDPSHSPTLTRDGTQSGVILGTASYMAPEQARGKAVDKRADIWAFGVVLFEMLSGHRPFPGETLSDILASILTREPDWKALPAETPTRIRELLRRCLTRDPKERLRDIGDARQDLEPGPTAAATQPAANVGPGWRAALPWAVAALGVAFGLIGPRVLEPRRPSRASPVRLSVDLGPDVSLDVSRSSPAVVLSPDGSSLAFVGLDRTGEAPRLFLRRLTQLEASALPGTEGAQSPFFSPDGQSIGFFADDKLKRVAVDGGAVVALAEAPAARGGSWSDDDAIFFTPNGVPGVGVSRVPASGGPTTLLTTPDANARETSHRWPQALPGGKAVLFTADRTLAYFETANIAVQVLPKGPRKVVVQGGYHGRYLSSGHIVYVHAATLFAVPFDLRRLEVTGPAAAVVEGVAANPFTGMAQFSISNQGTLAYMPGSMGTFSIQWLNRSGKLSPLRATAASYRSLQFSPDGTRLAMQVFDDKSADIWVYDWSRDRLSRLSFGVAGGTTPVWSPDGSALAYSSSFAGDVYWQRSDRTGEAQVLARNLNFVTTSSWHPSGKYLALAHLTPDSRGTIIILPIEGDSTSGFKAGEPIRLPNGGFDEGGAVFSPDGRWLAYVSNESGRFEVYVRPFPGPGGKWQISTDGGSQVVWSPRKHELVYETQGRKLMAVSYTAEGSSFRAEKPRLWTEVGMPTLRWNFDLHPDGERAAILQEVAGPDGPNRHHLVLFQNFFDELRRLAPPGATARSQP